MLRTDSVKDRIIPSQWPIVNGTRSTSIGLPTPPLELERIGQWREAFTRNELMEFESAAGDLLKEPGFLERLVGIS